MSKINKIKVENEIYDVQDNTSGYVNKDVNNLTNYELKVSTANNILMTLNNTTYELTLSLRNSANEVLNTQSVDLPLETMVVDGEYDSTNKKIVLELQNGNTIDVPVGDLINGLQSEITSSNKLDASLVDDSLSTNKFTNATEKEKWNSIPVTSISNINNNTQNNPLVLYDLTEGVYDIGALQSNTLYYKLYSDSEVATYKLNFGSGILTGLNVYKTVKEIEDYYVEHPTANNITFGYIYGISNLGKYTRTQITISRTKTVTTNLGSVEAYALIEKAQSFIGRKTFNIIPEIASYSAPTQDTQLTAKKYVDDLVASISGGSEVGYLLGNQEINFSDLKTGVYLIRTSFDYFKYKTTNSQLKTLSNISPLLLLYYKDVNEIGTPSSTTGFAILMSISRTVSYLISPYPGTILMDELKIDTQGEMTNGTFTYSNNVSFLTSGNQAITGEKIFNTIPALNPGYTYTITNDNQLVNKKYVDDSIASAITTTLNGSY